MLLRELESQAQKMLSNGSLDPIGYKTFGKASPVRWILHLDPRTGDLIQKEEVEIVKDQGQISHKPRPCRQRSGTVSSDNVKPYLLVDEARYVLGLSEPGKEQETNLQHEAFLNLLSQAADKTGIEEIHAILHFLRNKVDRKALGQEIKPKDVVTFLVGSPPYPFEKDEVKKFWREYLESEFASEVDGVCSVCGRYGRLIQTLPLEVVIVGQKCQLTSFNKTAFLSYGKDQTLNASMCTSCGLLVPQSLDYFIKKPQHNSILIRDESKGGSKSSLQNQLAVYWLRHDQDQTVKVESIECNLLSLLAATLAQPLEAETQNTLEPETLNTLALLEKFLKIPWSGEDFALNISTNAFYLTVLSANKGRLVVREWIETSLPELRERLRKFLSALRLVGPRGEKPTVFSIPMLLRPLNSTDPNLLRGILRTAYLGFPPPPGILETTVNRMRTPRGRSQTSTNQQPSPFWLLASATKFALTHGTKEAEAMEKLDPQHYNAPYLCGRLLALLEEAQRRAAAGKLNTTVVDRFYGAVSTSPAAALSPLVKLALTAHLPKIRRDNRGYSMLNGLLTEVFTALDQVGGIPRTLSLIEQAWFALGFYHQRAALALPSHDRNV